MARRTCSGSQDARGSRMGGACGETGGTALSLFNRPVNWCYFNALSALKRTEADGLCPVSGSLQIELPQQHLHDVSPGTLEVSGFQGEATTNFLHHGLPLVC